MQFKDIVQICCAIPFYITGWISGMAYRAVSFCWLAVKVGFMKAQGIVPSEFTTRN